MKYEFIETSCRKFVIIGSKIGQRGDLSSSKDFQLDESWRPIAWRTIWVKKKWWSLSAFQRPPQLTWFSDRWYFSSENGVPYLWEKCAMRCENAASWNQTDYNENLLWCSLGTLNFTVQKLHHAQLKCVSAKMVC